MSIEDRIAKIRDKMAKLAIKTAAVATLMTGTGAASSCSNHGDDNNDKIENVKERDETDGTKTSVVFRSTHNSYKLSADTDILMENGDELDIHGKDRFLEPGDTVTYRKGNKSKLNGENISEVIAVRYKGKPEVKKNVDFGKIGKDITD